MRCAGAGVVHAVRPAAGDSPSGRAAVPGLPQPEGCAAPGRGEESGQILPDQVGAVRPGRPTGSARFLSARVSKELYRRAHRTERLLCQWEQAGRSVDKLMCALSANVPESARVGKQPEIFTDLVNLVVDMERFLGLLDDLERCVVLHVSLLGRSEAWVGWKLGMSQADVSRAYWRGILRLDALLERAGYFAGA